MRSHESRFHSPLGASDVLDVFRALVAFRHWQVTWQDEHRVHAQSGLTSRGAGEDMEVSAEPDGAGSKVHIAARSRLGRLQLVDWGEAGSFYREIVEWLHDWAETGEGIC